MTTFVEMMNKINAKLELYNQKIRVIEYKRSSMTFSNNVMVSSKEKRKIMSKLRAEYTTFWIENFDDFINGVITENEVHHMFAMQRGKQCWSMHGEKIRKNLNTGIPWSKGKKGNYPYTFGPRTDEVKQKISEKNSGSNNGRYGYVYTEEDRNAKSAQMKSIIKDGKFTPNSNSRFTHWATVYNGKKYRSSWEALYQFFAPTAMFEKLRISYTLNNREYIYIVDFIDPDRRLVVEVKPKEMCIGAKFSAKMLALQEWAHANNYTVLLVTKEWFIDNTDCPDLIMFDNKAAKQIGYLYETGKKNRN
jgi:hypothetical protein